MLDDDDLTRRNSSTRRQDTVGGQATNAGQIDHRRLVIRDISALFSGFLFVGLALVVVILRQAFSPPLDDHARPTTP